MKIPQDMSIVGFDDSFLTELSEVKLTSVEHPKAELGRAAGKLILDLIESGHGKGSEAAIESIVFPTKLVERQSTQAIGEETLAKIK